MQDPVPRGQLWLDEYLRDDEPTDEFEELRRFLESQPTGGKGSRRKMPFFDSVQRDVTENQAEELLTSYQDLLRAYARVQKMRREAMLLDP